MENVILVIHLLLALSIIGLVLLQRSEGGGLGIGGGGLGGLATPQGAANLLTRMTAICAALFFLTSLVLGIMAGRDTSGRVSLSDALAAPVPQQEGTKDAAPAPEAPSSDKQSSPADTPGVPIAK
jgi:preprotein translocase subunit SecG